MTIAEFLNFRKEAMIHNQWFYCYMLPECMYMVEADIEFLTNLGF